MQKKKKKKNWPSLWWEDKQKDFDEFDLNGEFDLLDELNLNFGKGQSFNLNDGLRGVGLKEGWDLGMLTRLKKE